MPRRRRTAAPRPRSKNPRFTIWGTGPQRAQSRRFGDGNLAEDARIAGEVQRQLREDFYARNPERIVWDAGR